MHELNRQNNHCLHEAAASRGETELCGALEGINSMEKTGRWGRGNSGEEGCGALGWDGVAAGKASLRRWHLSRGHGSVSSGENEAEARGRGPGVAGAGRWGGS